MKVRYRESKDLHDTVLDYSESQFTPDELVKQIAQRLRDNQSMYSLSIEDFQLYEKGANALRHAILGHKSLRYLSLLNVLVCSYPVDTDDEYFFPKDLDNAVDHLCAILRDARLHSIKITRLEFRDRTNHHYEHFDMVDPTVMRDILLQEKQPYYIKEISHSLNHNPHLLALTLSMVDLDVAPMVKEIEANIKMRHTAEKINEVLQGTHATVETHMFPEIFKYLTTLAWWRGKMKK